MKEKWCPPGPPKKIAVPGRCSWCSQLFQRESGWWFGTATGSTPPSGCGWAGKALSVLFHMSSHGSFHGDRCHWQWWVCPCGGGC